MILVGGKDDGVITPWESRYSSQDLTYLMNTYNFIYLYSHFSFYGDKLTVVPMKEQEVRR